jgi:hypothetical protein
MGLTSWFRSAEPKHSTPDGPSPTKAELLAREMADIEDAFAAADLIINDDMDGAETRIRKGDSSYHQLALAVISFTRAVLGFERDVIAQTSTQLAACEARALGDQRRAQKEFTACETGIYPPGTEYALVQIEALLMSAVVGVTHESITEGIRSFYKMRKAYWMLDGIIQMESKRLKIDQGEKERPQKSLAEEYEKDKMPGTFDDDEFRDGEEGRSEVDKSGEAQAKKSTDGGSTRSSAVDSNIDGARNSGETAAKTSIGDFDAECFSSPRDVFVHSGATLCFGSLLFMLSVVPPALSKLLSIIGFKGDRERGIRMLWESTAFPNVHGAIAGVVLLSYYNGLLGLSDILPTEEFYDASAEVVGLPGRKCEALLAQMRARYPNSVFWLWEQSRMLANARRLGDALDVLAQMPPSNMKQIDALAAFETAMDSLFAMRWPLMRKSFLRCVEVNEWSKTMYYYMVGIAELEMYRDAFHGGDVDEARRRKKAAEDMFRTAPTMSGKKKFMAKQLPFELFVLRKLQKWEARAAEMDLDLADAVGVSPAQEMLYLWNGGKRTNDEESQRALKDLAWERCTASKEDVEKMKGIDDEAGVQALCIAPMLRNLGRTDEAREGLGKHILAFGR